MNKSNWEQTPGQFNSCCWTKDLQIHINTAVVCFRTICCCVVWQYSIAAVSKWPKCVQLNVPALCSLHVSLTWCCWANQICESLQSTETLTAFNQEQIPPCSFFPQAVQDQYESYLRLWRLLKASAWSAERKHTDSDRSGRDKICFIALSHDACEIRWCSGLLLEETFV